MINRDLWHDLVKSLATVFAHPIILVPSILWGLFLLGAVLWLPNIELLKALLDSEALSMWAKVGFMLEMYQILFTLLGFLQILLMLMFVVLSTLATGTFIFVLHRQHKGKVAPHESNAVLLASVGTTGLSMIGLMLLTPVITISGLAFGYRLHIFGVLLGLTGLTGMMWSIVRLSKLIKTS